MPLPDQRWITQPAQAQLVQQLADELNLSPLVAQVLVSRGKNSLEAAQTFLHPETWQLPDPREHFSDLTPALDCLEQAVRTGQPIAICGDYDADGMTSTALLLRTFRQLGAKASYEIPSRAHDGYGINERMVLELAQRGVSVILTVDNGIVAFDPIAKAKALGLTVIITDHHEPSPDGKLPVADAILNPKLIPVDSPFRGLAGVGVAYVLACLLAERFNQRKQLAGELLELFTLGTIADMAPLTGVNRRWVRWGLQRLPHSNLAGIQALIEVTRQGRGEAFRPDAVGFGLGPRINAMGRIDDPRVVIELLTTDFAARAKELALVCEEINRERQQLCKQIEQEAVAWLGQNPIDFAAERVLLLVQENWHHGVIGIVASRLKERYGVPVFIGSLSTTEVRGSARGIPEFHVFEALEFCKDLLAKHGGHEAAGGFSLDPANLPNLRQRLRQFATGCLKPEQLRPLVEIDACADLADLSLELMAQLDQLQPCGIGNPEPIFCSRGLQVIEQRTMGQENAHLRLTVRDKTGTRINAVAWRWGAHCPLPEQVDLAYKLRTNTWKEKTSLQLELVGARPSTC
ncbi:single-stranded-DNA-specific exonuclease RecJ [Leptolyngbya sp. FACHB-261]|uniref:single-stranded-DNA-specific exonuclease RecJ n=1 Tax=Leptolyngbya sp. FACHB-261 TaxID=2692806 RepID=UPI00168822C9|nr:single-stranded-DNA-specific exonuclease RecJ [Leptolyngbya sp. FACHB-261]MBD2100683.1 single-stranded-DNA-specific exonuclease RecJ [Leptolyngbya sp. FACHB-261]